jgi:hypothetical protein
LKAITLRDTITPTDGNPDGSPDKQRQPMADNDILEPAKILTDA